MRFGLLVKLCCFLGADLRLFAGGCACVCVDLIVFVVLGLLGLFGVDGLLHLIVSRLSVSVSMGGFGIVRLVC